MRPSIKRANYITFVEVTLTAAVLAILAAIIIPFVNRANQKGKMAQWKSLRNELLLDQAIVAYFDFADGKGDVLSNSVTPSNQGPQDPFDFEARIMPGVDWVKDRWGMKWGLDFTGESSYVFSKFSLPDHSNTVILWFRTEEQDAALFSATKTRDLSSKTFRSIILSKGNVVSITGNGSVKSSKNCSDNNWHMVAVTMGAKYNKHILYLDGEKVGDFDDFTLGYEEQENVFLGYSNNSPYFKGIMDEFMIFKRELSSEEIKKIYSTSAPQ